MARILGQDVTSLHLDDADGSAVDYTDLLMELGDLPNPTTVVETTVLTADESTAKGGSRGGATGSITLKLDDGAASSAGFKQLAAAVATGTPKTLTAVLGGLTIAYEVIMSNLVPNFTRDEEATMVLSWQQTGPIAVS